MSHLQTCLFPHYSSPIVPSPPRPTSSPGTEPAGSTLSPPLGRADIEHSISSETAEGRNEGGPLCAETSASPESTPASTAPPKKKTSKAKRQRATGPGAAPNAPASLPVADMEAQQVTEESSSGPSPSCAPPSAPPPEAMATSGGNSHGTGSSGEDNAGGGSDRRKGLARSGLVCQHDSQCMEPRTTKDRGGGLHVFCARHKEEKQKAWREAAMRYRQRKRLEVYWEQGRGESEEKGQGEGAFQHGNGNKRLGAPTPPEYPPPSTARAQDGGVQHQPFAPPALGATGTPGLPPSLPGPCVPPSDGAGQGKGLGCSQSVQEVAVTGQPPPPPSLPPLARTGSPRDPAPAHAPSAVLPPASAIPPGSWPFFWCQREMMRYVAMETRQAIKRDFDDFSQGRPSFRSFAIQHRLSYELNAAPRRCRVKPLMGGLLGVRLYELESFAWFAPLLDFLAAQWWEVAVIMFCEEVRREEGAQERGRLEAYLKEAGKSLARRRAVMTSLIGSVHLRSYDQAETQVGRLGPRYGHLMMVLNIHGNGELVFRRVRERRKGRGREGEGEEGAKGETKVREEGKDGSRVVDGEGKEGEEERSGLEGGGQGGGEEKREGEGEKEGEKEEVEEEEVLRLPLKSGDVYCYTGKYRYGCAERVELDAKASPYRCFIAFRFWIPGREWLVRMSEAEGAREGGADGRFVGWRKLEKEDKERDTRWGQGNKTAARPSYAGLSRVLSEADGGGREGGKGKGKGKGKGNGEGKEGQGESRTEEGKETAERERGGTMEVEETSVPEPCAALGKEGERQGDVEEKREGEGATEMVAMQV